MKSLLSPFVPFSLLIIMFFSVPVSAAEVLISDAGVEISREEFEAIVDTMPLPIKTRIAGDVAERLEIINSLLVARKVAALADNVTADDEEYWGLQFAIIGAKYDFLYKKLQSEIKPPDFEVLARERYTVNKEKYARVPEVRASSHILLASRPGLDRTEVHLKANEILEQLRDGADFAEMVEVYSEDPGSKARGGSLNRYIKFGDPKITPPYSEALFSIENIGEYSEVTDSQFGVHIIRLDGIQESYLAEYEQVKDAIIADINREYATAANAELRARFNVTDELYIDGPEMEAILAPYKEVSEGGVTPDEFPKSNGDNLSAPAQ